LCRASRYAILCKILKGLREVKHFAVLRACLLNMNMGKIAIETNDYKTTNRIRQYIPLFIVMALQLVIKLILNQWDFYIDDPIINLRYTQNLLRGWGFVYNQGEYILGTTTPLYALVLVIPSAFGLQVWEASRYFNIVADLVNLVLIYLILKNYSKTSIAPILGTVIFAVSPFWNIYAMDGMETPFVIMLMLGAFYASLKEKRVWVGILLGLSVWARIDSILYVSLLLLALWWVRHKLPIKELCIMILTVLPWLIFAFFYYGSPIPVTLKAKMVYYRNLINPIWAIPIIVRVFSNSVIPIIPCIILAMIGIVNNFKNKMLIMLMIWILGFTIINMFVSPNGHIWYYLPPIVILIIPIALGMDKVCSILQKFIKSIKIKFALATLVLVSAAFASLPTWLDEGAKYIHFLFVYTAYAKTECQWLARYIPRDATLCTACPGFIGIYTKLRLLDTGCLISPQLIPYYYNQGWDEAETQIIRDYQPDFCFVLVNLKAVSDDYLTLKDFIHKYKTKSKDPTNFKDTLWCNSKSKYAQELLRRKATGDPKFNDEYVGIKGFYEF
jgi:hypothetical protein